MLVIVAVLLGVAMGARTAKKRGGNAADMAQYAFGYAMAFGLIAWVLTLLISGLLG